MLPKSVICLVFTALLFLFSDVHAADERQRLKDSFGLSRDAVIDNHQRRRSQLQKLVDEGKARLDDHESGRKLMETEEFEKMSKRIRLYEQKLSRMAEQPDEREIARTLEREQQRMERRSRREL